MLHLIDLQPGVLEDLRGIPTCECACGGTFFYALIQIDTETRLPGWYALDGQCADCGRVVTLATPVDIGFETSEGSRDE